MTAAGRRGRWVVATIVALLGTAYLAVNSQYPLVRGGQPGPGLFPLLVGLLLLVSALGYGLEASPAGGYATGGFSPTGAAGLRRAGAILLAAIGVVVIAPITGEFVATAIAILVVVRAKGMRNWAACIVTAVGMAGAITLAFGVLLKVPIPPGIWTKWVLP